MKIKKSGKKASPAKSNKTATLDDLDELEKELKEGMGLDMGDDDGDDDLNELASGDEEVDLDEMDKSELLEFIKEQELSIPKAKGLTPKKLRVAIAEAMEDSGDEGGDEDGEVDLDEMDKSELLDFIKENEIDIPKSKAKAMTPKKLRIAIAEALEGNDEGGDENGDEGNDGEVDLDEMDKSELLDFIKENEIDIPKSKAKAMTPKKLRIAIAEAMEDSGDDEGNDENDGEVDLDSMKKKELRLFAKENELGIAPQKMREMGVKELRTAIKKKLKAQGGSSSGKSETSSKAGVSSADKKKIATIIKALQSIIE